MKSKEPNSGDILIAEATLLAQQILDQAEKIRSLQKAHPQIAHELQETLNFLHYQYKLNGSNLIPALVKSAKTIRRNRSNASHHISAKTIINEWAELEIVGKGTKTELALALGISRTTLNELLKKYELTDRIKKANS